MANPQSMTSLVVFAFFWSFCPRTEGAPDEGSERQEPAANQQHGGGSAESSWLTTKELKQMLSDSGYGDAQEVGSLLMVAVTDSADPKRVFVDWADLDSLKVTASWWSPQRGLEDMPIANRWNNERRFCKVSIADAPPGGEGGSLLVMSMDQMVYAARGKEQVDAVKKVVQRSLDLFRAAVFEFDKFLADTYQLWQQKRLVEKQSAASESSDRKQ
eukprot:Hpha_TRINITY_DN17412_c0_g1::TRINITY_DN17412_c0_g1_i1::g.85825::m.85825